MNEICRLLFAQVQDKLDRKFGCFEIFGLDFMLDDQLNPVLIEVNTNPAIFTDTVVQKEIIPHLVADIVKVATTLHQPNRYEAVNEVENLLSTADIGFDIQADGSSAWVGPKPKGLQSLQLDYHIIEP